MVPARASAAILLSLHLVLPAIALAAPEATEPSWWVSLWSFLWPILLKIISIGAMVLLVLSVLLMVLTYKKAKKIRPLALILSILASLTSLAIYSALLRVNLAWWAWLTALSLGAMVGAGWSLTSKLVRQQGLLKTQGNVWHLVVWGLVFAANQLIVIFTGRPANVALLLLLASTGLVVGNSTSILVRFYRAR